MSKGVFRIIQKIKSLEWQTKLAIVIVFALVIVEYNFFSGFKHLPGPMYGGDIYAHLGFTQNYINNGFWTDPYFVGEYAYYAWLGNLGIAIFSFVFGLSLMKGMIYFPILTTILSAMAYWFLGKQVFKSKTYALITMVAYLAYNGIPGAAPNSLAWMITTPFFFYFWLKSEEESSWKNKLFAGVFLGLTSLVQVAFFLSALSIFIFTTIIETFHNKKRVKDYFRKYALIFLVGLIVSLPFYGVIIVKYHGLTKNPLFQYNDRNVDLLGVGWAADTVISYFFNNSNTFRLVEGLIALAGIYVAITNFGKLGARFTLLWFIIGALIPLHHLITRPLFDKFILPGHLWGISVSFILFFVYGLIMLFSLADKYLQDKSSKAKFVLVAIILIPLLIIKIQDFDSDRWVNYGRNLDPLTKAWLDAGEWIQKNTDKNTVFLAYDESCFAMNGVSGRKCVAVRRTHANYFVDVEQRYADAIIMLYGKNETTSNNLIQRYNVSYVLIDPYLLQSYWKIMPKFEDYLKENGIEYKKGKDRLDPAVADAKQFDLLIVQAQNITLQNKMKPETGFPASIPQIAIFKVED